MTFLSFPRFFVIPMIPCHSPESGNRYQCHSPENGNRYGNDVWEQTDIAIAISVCSGDIYKNKYLLLRESINIDSRLDRE